MSEICVHCSRGRTQHNLKSTDAPYEACPRYDAYGGFVGWHPTNRFTPRREEQFGQHATDEAKAENLVGGATTGKHVEADDHEGSKMGSERLTSAVHSSSSHRREEQVMIICTHCNRENRHRYNICEFCNRPLDSPATVQPSGGEIEPDDDHPFPLPWRVKEKALRELADENGRQCLRLREENVKLGIRCQELEADLALKEKAMRVMLKFDKMQELEAERDRLDKLADSNGEQCMELRKKNADLWAMLSRITESFDKDFSATFPTYSSQTIQILREAKALLENGGGRDL